MALEQQPQKKTNIVSVWLLLLTLAVLAQSAIIIHLLTLAYNG